ncbi:DUF2523 family protein [Acinetobacter proteolyticus]|nr:DUF2523 family protein [Acinetobacter proteolyticus]
MPRMLILLAGFILSGAVKKMIVGAGLGLVAMTVIQSVFDRYVEKVLHFSTSGFEQNVVMFLSLSGIDDCLSVILGAVFARVAINAMTLSLAKAA